MYRNGILNGVLYIILAQQHRGHQRELTTCSDGFIPMHLMWLLQPLSIRTQNSKNNSWQNEPLNHLMRRTVTRQHWGLRCWGIYMHLERWIQ